MCTNHYYSFLNGLMLLASETKLHTNFRSYNSGMVPEIYQAEISYILLRSEVHNWGWDKGLHAEILNGLQYSLIHNIQERSRHNGDRGLGRIICFPAPANPSVGNGLKLQCSLCVPLEILPSYFIFLELIYIYYTPFVFEANETTDGARVFACVSLNIHSKKEAVPLYIV